MSIDSENHDPEFVQRANGRLLFATAIFGMVFFIGAMGLLITFGVPFDGHPLGGQAQQASGQISGQQQAAGPQTSGQASGQQAPKQPPAEQKADQAPARQPSPQPAKQQ